MNGELVDVQTGLRADIRDTFIRKQIQEAEEAMIERSRESWSFLVEETRNKAGRNWPRGWTQGEAVDQELVYEPFDKIAEFASR